MSNNKKKLTAIYQGLNKCPADLTVLQTLPITSCQEISPRQTDQMLLQQTFDVQAI